MADNNISPDMINNLINMFKDKTSTLSSQNSEINSNSNYNCKEVPFSTLNEQSSTSSESFNSTSSVDFETIMKIKSIIDNLNNSNDQDSKLLYSLKPYLRKSRQEKLDQYINILKITQVSKLLNKKNEHKNGKNKN